MTIEELGHIDIRGSSMIATNLTATMRLNLVRGLVEARYNSLDNISYIGGPERGLLPPAWRNAPAFEAHIRSGLAEILADAACLQSLKEIVEHGEEARVVTFLWEQKDRAAVMLANASGALAAAFIAGKALRHISSGSARS